MVGEKDLESLLKFIEGKTREECKDPKRIAKRARQKKRKLEEKERMMEEEADRKRLEAMKKQVTISVVNDNNKKYFARHLFFIVHKLFLFLNCFIKLLIVLFFLKRETEPGSAA